MGEKWKFKLFEYVPKKYHHQFEEARRKTNISRMQALSIYIIGIQVILNIVNALKPSDNKSSNINSYIMLSMVMLAIGILYCILLTLVKKEKINGRWIKWFLSESLLYIYVVIQMIFCTLNIISTGGVNSYIIAILIVGLFPVIPPVQSIVTIVLTLGYLFIASFATKGVSTTWDSILLTDTWANLIIITGITICISVFIYNMYVSNFNKSLHLEKSNNDLIEANCTLEQMNETLEVIANTDQMTGVMNRRAFDQNFDEVWKASCNRKSKIAVTLVDLDFFKQYNDTFGHLAGDVCLQKVAASLRRTFRRSGDLVCRFGGEEFLIVFNADKSNAYDLVELARKNVEALCIEHATNAVSKYVTISAGICVTVPSVGILTDRVLKIADEALYESKKTGRNRTKITEYCVDEPKIEAQNSSNSLTYNCGRGAE